MEGNKNATAAGTIVAGKPTRKRTDSDETLIYDTEADYFISINSDTEEEEEEVQILEGAEDLRRDSSFSSSITSSSCSSSVTAASTSAVTAASTSAVTTAYDKIMTTCKAPELSALARFRERTVPSTGKVSSCVLFDGSRYLGNQINYVEKEDQPWQE
jgi:hypothetical protein